MTELEPECSSSQGHIYNFRPDVFTSQSLLKCSMPKQAGAFTLTGYSRAAEATGFSIAELGWVLDAGILAHSKRPEHVFISHTHADHIYQLIYLKSRRKPPHIYVPAHAVELVKKFLDLSQELTNPRALGPSEPPSYFLHGVHPGDVFQIKRGGDLFEVEVLQCGHSVPCVGYRFSIVREKLKPEFALLPGRQIGELRRAGESITEQISTPLFAYLGDTTIDVFERHPCLLQTPFVMTECTFLDPEHRGYAHKTRHTHWEELRDIVSSAPNTLFLLMHFSLRYDAEFIHSFFVEQDFSNVFPWLE